MVQDAGSIFISYRRATTRDITGRIADRLIARFPERRVFLDVDSITGGALFRDVITTAIEQSAAVVVVIGPGWSTRLDDPDDVVRLEVAVAVEAGVEIVPVVVDGATLPDRTDLPEPIRPLLDRSALWMHPDQFDSGMDRVIAALRRGVEPSSRAGWSELVFDDPTEILRPASVAELRAMSRTRPLLVVTERTERGPGESSAVARFRRSRLGRLRRLCDPSGTRVAWVNVGGMVRLPEVTRFFATQGVRFIGVHLFVDGQLTDSRRTTGYLGAKYPDLDDATEDMLTKKGLLAP